jgi:DNA-binding transcriptional ArsR family regulator
MELPESKLIKSEIILRDMDLTNEVKMTRKSLVRWLALSLGLISKKESRQSVLNVLEALLYYHLKEKKEPNYQDLVDYFNKNNLQMNEKTVRYHLTQLRKSGVLEENRGVYRFAGFQFDNLPSALEASYQKRAYVAFFNIKDALSKLEEMYNHSQ